MVTLIFSAIDASWAIPLNTALLIILTALNMWRTRRVSKRVDFVSQQAADAKNKCGANRRDEDVKLIEDVKAHVPAEAKKRRFGRRFYDGEKNGDS